MHRFPAVLVLALSSITAVHAGAQGSDRVSDGFTPGAYLRIGGESVAPISPEGSMRDWDRGQGLNLSYENWVSGSSGRAVRVGFGFFVDYSLLPFDGQQFVADSVDLPAGRPTSATAKRAQILQFGVNTRIRIPAPFIMPSIGIGFGFLDWRPGKVQYETANGGTGTAKQQNRSGGELTLFAGLDKHIYDRWALFAEAAYTYAYTSFGQGLAASGSSCRASNCDLLKNTQLGVIRGGVRVKIGE